MKSILLKASLVLITFLCAYTPARASTHLIESYDATSLDTSKWTVVNNGGISVNSTNTIYPGYLNFSGTNNWNENSVYTNSSFSRTGGKAFITLQRHDVAVPHGVFHFSTSKTPTTPDQEGYGIRISNTEYAFRSVVPGGNILYRPIGGTGTFYSHDYLLATVLRPSGSYHLISGGRFGTFPNATLLWVNEQGTDTSLYAGINIREGNSRHDFTRVIDLGGSFSTQYGLASAADTFNRANSGSSGTTEVGNSTWDEEANSWSITNGKLELDSSGVGRVMLANISSEGIFEADVTPSESDGDAGIIARYSDSDNYLVYAFEGAAIKLYKKESGSFSLITQVVYSYSEDTTYRMRLFIHGNTICLYINNELPVGSCSTESFNSSATGAGLYASDAGTTFDNVAFWPKTVALSASEVGDFPTIPTASSTVLASDSFTDTNATSLQSHTMTSGNGWSVPVGTWSIQSNSAQAGSRNAIAVTEVGVSDMSVEADITLPTASSGTTEWFSGLIARYSDVNNYVRARFLWQNGSPEIEVWQIKDGTQTFPTAVNLTSGVSEGGTYTMRLVVEGRQLSVYFDDQLVSQGTTTLTSGTYAGLVVDNEAEITSPFITVDNFEVRSTINDTTPPPEIVDLSLTSGSGSSAPVLNWTNVIDDAAGTNYYRVYRSTSNGSLGTQISPEGSPTSGNFTDNGLTGSGSYYYTVRAVDINGNEQDSSYNNQTSYAYSIGGVSQNSSQSNNAQDNSVPRCADRIPLTTPDLFQIDVFSKSVKLYFAPIKEPHTSYYIGYGYTPGDIRFGYFQNYPYDGGVKSATINHLSPRTTYHFQVKAINGCEHGPFSNAMQVQTTVGMNKGRYFKLIPYRFTF